MIASEWQLTYAAFFFIIFCAGAGAGAGAGGRGRDDDGVGGGRRQGGAVVWVIVSGSDGSDSRRSDGDSR